MVQPSLWGRFSTWMETGCYSPLENKMRCQLNCRPSVSQIFKGRKRKQRTEKQHTGMERAARWPARCSRRSARAQGSLPLLHRAPGWLRTALRADFSKSQQWHCSAALASSWTGDRRQVGRWPTPPRAPPAQGRRLTMQPADNKTLPSAVITP